MTDKSRIIAANADGIAQAVAMLQANGIVAVPTETVYGLAARAGVATAVAKIYVAKGRPSFNPLIVHVSGMAQAAELVTIDAVAHLLINAFWPGPLTLVLPLRPDAKVAGLVTAGLTTLAVRCPAHAAMQALIAGAGPLAAPSANASGRISSTSALHVAESLGDRIGLILDGGRCASGLESTIVETRPDGWQLLRPGAVPVETIIDIAGAASKPALKSETPGKPTAPGMLDSHYAPRQPVRMAALTAQSDEFHIGFGAISGDLNLSSGGDLVEAAACLFEALHVAQASGRAGIAVAPIPETGLGLAINDRLRRAAAPRW